MPPASEHALYPLAVGNRWTYVQKNGSSFTNEVTAVDPQAGSQFIMVNSLMQKDQRMKKDGTSYYTDAFEEENFQLLLKDDVQAGERWEITFQANGFQNILVMTAKETDGACDVDGKTYQNVTIIEAASFMLINGNRTDLHFTTTYAYAKGVGLVLTTSSAGDRMALTSYALK